MAKENKIKGQLIMCSHAFHQKVTVEAVRKCILLFLHQLVIFYHEVIGTRMYFHYQGLDRSTNIAPKYNLILSNEAFHIKEHEK